jgi:long-chain acyl-CoA synthetase
MTETAAVPPFALPVERRDAATEEALFAPLTLPELFLHTAEHAPHIAALLSKEGGAWEPITYAELAVRIRHLALALEGLGIAKGDRVCILSENRPEWVIADLAITSVGAVVVPIYPSLPEAQVEYILRDAGTAAIFVSDQKQLAKALALRSTVPELKHVIAMDEPKKEAPDVLRFAALLEQGAGVAEGERRYHEHVHGVLPDDLASIVYTSGTTGEPKGAMLTHQNLSSNARAALRRFNIRPDDVILSYIPLSHIFSRIVNYCALSAGATTAFSPSIFTVGSYLQEVKPTLMPSIPRLFESIQSRVLAAAAKRPPRQKGLFDWALRVGAAYGERKIAGQSVPPWLAAGYALADFLVLHKVREEVGGRIRYFISGGAPLAPETGRFFNSVGLRIIEGYGLTETSPVIAANSPAHIKFGTVGPAVEGVEVRIAPDGEILCRGPNVMRDYFNKPDDTAQAINADGWFHTGDIGELDADGYLRITDRKKDLIVLSNGKNVAPQAIERALKGSPYITEAALFGDKQSVVVGLIVPDFAQVKTWAKEKGLALDSNAAIAASPEVRKLIKAEIEARQTEFADFERVRKFALLDREFSMDHEELTPTLKLKRRVVAQHFAETIQGMYGGGDKE